MKTILLLEKQGTERELLAAGLRVKGFHVVKAQDERSAIIALAVNPVIDLAVMVLPECDWPEFLLTARKNRNNLPMIVLTNCGNGTPIPRHLFPGVASLSLRQRCNSGNYHLLQELDRQIRLVLRTKPALAA